jgi:hypothetical protein
MNKINTKYRLLILLSVGILLFSGLSSMTSGQNSIISPQSNTAHLNTFSAFLGSITSPTTVNQSNSLKTTLASDSTSNVYYSVTFTETGLPTGWSWWVNLNGYNITSLSSSITFNVPDGDT